MNLFNWIRSAFSKKTHDSAIPIRRAIGIFNLADDFVQAGTQLTNINDISSVRYYLSCHGLELALKAFLVSQGTTDRKLRHIGHDLIRTLKVARRHDLFRSISFTEDDRDFLAWLNSYYKYKEFEYPIVGYKSCPTPEAVTDFAEHPC